jgi:hypothetical protein
MTTNIPQVGEILTDNDGEHFVYRVTKNTEYNCIFTYQLSEFYFIRELELLILRLRYK